MRNRILVLAAMLAISATFSFGQGGQGGQAQRGGGQGGQGAQGGGQRGGGGGRGQAAPARPAPRRADGRVHLGALPGEKGLWVAGITNLRVISEGGQIPYQDWSRAVAQHRREDQLEPHTRCKPSGGPRQFLTPYGVEFVELEDMKRIYIMDVGGPHTYREIFMDGRPHPKNHQPDYYGHSVGRWEGDTLVVESVGFNEKFWLDRGGAVHTEQLKLTERFTRLDANNMRYQATFDDPGAYTAPWTGEFNIRWTAGDELFEYICQDNNFASTLMVGVASEVDRTSQIVP